MHSRANVSPSTLTVRLLDHGVEVDYLDGRTVCYRGIPEPVVPPLRIRPGCPVHLLGTDTDGEEGALVYAGDRRTETPILERTGVGRVVLSPGDSATPIPAVTVERIDPNRLVVDADPGAADGRIFAFVEDDRGESQYELVAADAAGETGGGT